MQAAIYGRVSTTKQDYARQVEELRAYCGRQGWEVTEYLEKESAKSGSNRPVLTKMFADARLKKFGVVVVWKVDRFGRSVMEFSQNLQTLASLDVRFIATEQAIDTDKRNPLSKLLTNVLAIIAEFELDLIHERTEGGQKHYRELYAKGKIGYERHSKSGKDLPVGRPRKIFHRGRAVELRAKGLSVRAIASELAVSRMSVQRALEAA